MEAEQDNPEERLYSLSNDALRQSVQEALLHGGQLRFRARGTSMSPFIRNGDVLILMTFAGTPPSVGEVVAFEIPGSGALAIHRVIGHRSGAWLLRGDNLDRPDGWVLTEKILGRVVQQELTGRKLSACLGPERVVIATLSRSGLLFHILNAFRKLRSLMKSL